MSEPIGQGHTEPVGWQELMAVLEMELKGAPELVHREELMVVGQPEQIRSNADVRERGAVPNRDEGSRAIGSRFARIRFLDTLVLVAKSLPPSSSVFHKASKMRERGGVWSDALQPVMHPADVDGSRDHDMLKMGARLSTVTRTPQAHPTHSLSMYSFYACPLGILFLELFSLFSLAGGIYGKMRFLSPHG